MARKAAGLTAAKVRTAKPGRYGDGAGLYLLVRSESARFWLFRYKMPGMKMREMGLGSATGPGAVTLAEAREKVGELRRLVRAGTDPLQDRALKAAEREAKARAATARAKTFEEVTELYLDAHSRAWRSVRHRAQWAMTLRVYAGPHLGTLPVADIDTMHVVESLRPIWSEKPETARRLRGRIEDVLNFAAVQGWCSPENPARWRGHLDKMFPRPSKVHSVRHHAALPWQEVGGFMAALRSREAMAARALEFTILTAARSGEVRGMRWSELDLSGVVWTVPAQRMKAGREHRVPLSPAALDLLHKLQHHNTVLDRLVFSAQEVGRSLSDTTMAKLLQRMNFGHLTVHGFRSTFRDWAGETTHHAREVVEAALAHRLGNGVEQAYARGDLFLKRRKLMQEWAEYCGNLRNAAIAQPGHGVEVSGAVPGN